MEIALLLTLVTLWGSSFSFIKVAVETIPPLSVAAGRLLLGAAIVFVVARSRGFRFPADASLWARFFAIGLFGNMLPFTLIGWGEQVIDSGLAAILMAVMPLTTLLLAHLLTEDEKMTPPRVAGMILGFAGVVILVGPAVLKGLGGEALRQMAVAGGAMCYAVATVLAKRLPQKSLTANSAMALITATILTLPASLVIDRPWTISPSVESLGAVAVLGVFPTAIAIVVYFALLRRTGATFIALINYLIPVFGVVWGVILLGESVSLRALAALAVILSGIALTRIRLRSR